MAQKLETRLQRKIQKALKKEGGKFFKCFGSSFQEAGQPDLIGCVDGRFFGFEVKIPLKGKASDLQLQTLIEWREQGAIACIVETAEQAVTLVKAAKASPEMRYRGDRLYRWICRTLCAAFGEDMGYGRSPRGRAGHNKRRSARWAVDQLTLHLGKVPERETTLVLGAP